MPPRRSGAEPEPTDVSPAFSAVAPGRVNLIGDHTDYMGGLVLPMAIDLHTVVTGERGGDRIRLTSAQEHEAVDLALPIGDPAAVTPSWGRYVAGVAAQLQGDPGPAGAVPLNGLTGTVASTVPPGSGLSSSAALELAVALALGASGSPLELASMCQRAELAATGVPCGIMDQLCSAAGVADHALLIDCTTLQVTPVPVPTDVAVWVVDSGRPRTLDGSAYAERRAECEAAAALIGPLPSAPFEHIDQLDDELHRRRARHVRSECDRVRAFAAALSADDPAGAGELMLDSHASLRDDFEVSTATLDELVAELSARPGVHGARLTGAGFGGSVVALTSPDVDLTDAGAGGRRVVASAGASVEDVADTP